MFNKFMKFRYYIKYVKIFNKSFMRISVIKMSYFIIY